MLSLIYALNIHQHQKKFSFIAYDMQKIDSRGIIFESFPKVALSNLVKIFVSKTSADIKKRNALAWAVEKIDFCLWNLSWTCKYAY